MSENNKFGIQKKNLYLTRIAPFLGSPVVHRGHARCGGGAENKSIQACAHCQPDPDSLQRAPQTAVLRASAPLREKKKNQYRTQDAGTQNKTNATMRNKCLPLAHLASPLRPRNATRSPKPLSFAREKND
jgi:hypothetical protein